MDSGDFCLMDRRVVDALRQLPENLRFVRGLRAWVGFRQTALPYDRPARAGGASRYSWRRLYQLATDGVASTSIRPLQIAQFFSLIYLLVTAVFLVLLLVHGAFAGSSRLSHEMLLLAVLVASGNCVQSLCIYILGAYTGRGYLETKRRPTYLVMEVVGDDGESDGERG